MIEANPTCQPAGIRQILVAGIGNLFLGDDAFGIEVVRALAERELAEQVRVVDFGIRSYDLAYALTEGYETVILVDAVGRGEAPGTVYLIEPAVDQLPALAPGEANAHSVNVVNVLQMAQAFGELPRNLFLIGCEPAVLEDECGAMILSKEVGEAIPQAVTMIESLIGRLLSREPKTNAGSAPV